MCLNRTPEAAIVIVGGFWSGCEEYQDLAGILREVSGFEVFISSISSVEWMVAFVRGFASIVDKVGHTVDQALAQTGAEKVVLVGYSVGGVAARLYLGDRTSIASRNNNSKKVSDLITLGTPHQVNGSWFGMRKGIHVANKYYPGAYRSPDVRYLSVAGKKVFGRILGSAEERRAYWNYYWLARQGGVWGDGVVPTDSAILAGSRVLILPGVGHRHIGYKDNNGAGRWYGEDEATVQRWWTHLIE